MRKRGIIGTLLPAGVPLQAWDCLPVLRWRRYSSAAAAAKTGADPVCGYDFRADGQKRGRTGAFVNIAGNIALLFPLGLFLPLFWRWFERAGRTIWWCFGTSLSIELIQLAAGGVTSADDLLLNTLGGALWLRGGKASDEKRVPSSRRRAREGQSGQHRLSAGSSSSRQVQYPIC